MNLRLDIQRLVLDGFDLDARGRELLRGAFEAEMARLLASGGIADGLAAGRALAAMSVPALAAPAGATPAQLGQALAGSIYGGIGR